MAVSVVTLTRRHAYSRACSTFSDLCSRIIHLLARIQPAHTTGRFEHTTPNTPSKRAGVPKVSPTERAECDRGQTKAPQHAVCMFQSNVSTFTLAALLFNKPLQCIGCCGKHPLAREPATCQCLCYERQTPTPTTPHILLIHAATTLRAVAPARSLFFLPAAAAQLTIRTTESAAQHAAISLSAVCATHIAC